MPKKVTTDCTTCGKRFTGDQNGNGSKREFCSLPCKYEGLAERNMQAWLADPNGYNYAGRKSKHKRSGPRTAMRRWLTKTFGYKCSMCGISEWNAHPITLQIDHVNGNAQDNTPQNLRFLCPNCHSQTDTYVGKKR